MTQQQWRQEGRVMLGTDYTVFNTPGQPMRYGPLAAEGLACSGVVDSRYWRPRWYQVPVNRATVVPSRSEVIQQLTIVPGSWLIGMNGFLSAGSLNDVSVLLADWCTREPLFSTFEFGTITRATTPRPVLLAHPISVPGHGLVAVTLGNRSAASITFQLLLHVSEPVGGDTSRIG